MALVPCRECGREVSTHAAACPHCGMPMADAAPAQQSAAQPAAQPSPARPDLTVTRSPRADQGSAGPDADVLERLRGRRGKLGPISGSVLGFVLMAMLFGLCWQAGLEAERTTARQASVAGTPPPATAPEPNLPDLELLEKGDERGQFGEHYITGRIRNNRARTYSYAQVQIGLFNKAGEQVGSTLANTNNLESGGVWRFKAIVLQDDATEYRIGDITGW